MTKLNCRKTISFMCALFFTMVIDSTAQTFTTLVHFHDGSSVISSLIQGRDGNLYGLSNNGGTRSHGSVFKVSPSGVLTTLYSFCAQVACADGSDPFSVLVLGTDGNFYGTTQNGGAFSLGTVFKISPTGSFDVLHNFNGTDGSYPDAGLLLASDGNFYGSTFAGGSSNTGTIFKLGQSGTLTTLHNFSGFDGDAPSATVFQGTDGNLYGTTTYGGGSSACNFGCGTVFSISLGGKFTLLHTFSFTDGGVLYAPLVQAANGAFYGTTFEGGEGYGTIFKVSSRGAFATVLEFNGINGGNPDSGLDQATDGNLYGESQLSGDGEIFKLTLPRTISTEYSFSASSGGGGNTALVQATDGKLYGTYGVPGAIFSFDVGLDPFVAFVIPTGKAGKAVQILGQGLTGTTSVTFNDVPATSFKAFSETYMTAIVPNAATTGSVVVTTPTGTLTSNVNFRITK